MGVNIQYFFFLTYQKYSVLLVLCWLCPNGWQSYWQDPFLSCTNIEVWRIFLCLMWCIDGKIMLKHLKIVR